MLSEQEVSRSWSQLFNNGQFGSEEFIRAEQMLNDMRPESPLRHRLTHELEELREIHARRLSLAEA